jgi:hypothetical protein
VCQISEQTSYVHPRSHASPAAGSSRTGESRGKSGLAHSERQNAQRSRIARTLRSFQPRAADSVFSPQESQVLESPQTGITVDRSKFPIVLVWFGRTYTDEEWAASLTAIHELTRGKHKFVVLNVTRPDMETPSARHRKAIADWNADYVASGCNAILGWGSVIESTVLRGVITALHWVTKFPYAQATTSTLEQGLEWAQQILKKADE